MKRRILRILLTIVAFTVCFLFSANFYKKDISLPRDIAQSIRWLESLFTDKEVLLDDSVPYEKTGETTEAIVNSSDDEVQHFYHEQIENKSSCKDTSLGKVKYKKVGDIYTWTDENDVYHVSDKPPKSAFFKMYSNAGNKVFDYFSLNLNTENLPYDFNQKLTGKLNQLFAVYGNLLDVSSLKKVDINLRVFLSEASFSQVKQQHNMPTRNTSNGFYSHSNNQAYLLYTNDEQTMKTAVHEATHAINRAIIGYSPKWLNEGLAEYSENISVNSQVTKVHPNSSWTKNGILSERLLPLAKLFTTNNEQWDGKLRHRLYATSWAFIFFMMENPSKKSMLAKVIKAEQGNICDALKPEQLESLFNGSIQKLQNEFTSWSQKRVKVHSI
ncbi:hypothetical protein ACOYR1_15595 [Thalassotalea piscium]